MNQSQDPDDGVPRVGQGPTRAEWSRCDAGPALSHDNSRKNNESPTCRDAGPALSHDQDEGARYVRRMEGHLGYRMEGHLGYRMEGHLGYEDRRLHPMPPSPPSHPGAGRARPAPCDVPGLEPSAHLEHLGAGRARPEAPADAASMLMVPVQDHHTGNISVTVSDCTGSLLQDTCEYSQSSPQPKPPGFCGNTGHSPRATAPLTPQQPDRPCSDNSRKNQEDPSKGAGDTVQLLSPSTTAAPASNAGLGIQFKQPPSSNASGYALVHVRIILSMYVCMYVCVCIYRLACVCVSV